MCIYIIITLCIHYYYIISLLISITLWLLSSCGFVSTKIVFFSPNVMASFVKFNQEYDDTPCDCDTQTFWDTPNMSCLVDSNMVIWCLVEMVSPQLLVMFGYQRVSVKLHPCWSFRSFNDSSKFEYCIKGCQPHWGFGSVAWDVGTPRGTVRLQWPALLITFAQRN